MANSTVYTIKGDISDLEAKLKSVKAAADSAFSGYQNTVNKVTVAEKALTAAMAQQAEKLRPLREEVAALQRKKAQAGSLDTKEAARLKEVTAQLRAYERANRESNRVLNDRISSLNRLAAAQKKEASTNRGIAKEIDATVRSREKGTGASERHARSLRKENAERRSASTTLVRHIRRLESLAVAYFAVQRAYSATFGAGVQLNRQYESMSVGLAALISAKTQSVDATGRETDAMTHFLMAQEQTRDVLSEIRREATETPATFTQMVGFYQQAIGHALAAGQAFGDNLGEISHNTIVLTKRMSNLGASVGMSMDLINEEIRSLMSGDVTRDSKLALILFGNPTAANAAIKEAKTQVGGLTKLFNEKLAPFAVLENLMTFDKALNQTTAEIQIIQQAASEPIFDDMKASFQEITKYLQENSTEISSAFQNIYYLGRATFQSLADAGRIGAQGFDDFNASSTEAVAGMVDIENVAVGLSATIAIMAKAFQNAGILVENSVNGWKLAYAYVTMSEDEFAKYAAEVDAATKKNWAHVASLDDMAAAAEAAGKNARQLFALNQDLAKWEVPKILPKTDDTTAIAYFNRLEKQHEDYRARYAGNVAALSQIDQDYYRKKQRMADDYVVAQAKAAGAELKLKLEATAADEKEAEAIKKLYDMLLKSQGDEYSQLIAKRQDLLKGAGESAKQRKIIEEIYQNELQKLNDNELKSYKRTQDEKEKADQTAAEKQLAVWERYYKRVGDAENAWLLSDERKKALEEATVAGLDAGKADEYLEKVKKAFMASFKDIKTGAKETFDYAKRFNEITDAYERGAMSAQKYRAAIAELNVEAANLGLTMKDASWSDVWISSLGKVTDGYQGFLPAMSDAFGDLFNQLADGFAQSAAHSILYADSMGEALRGVAVSAVEQLIAAIIKMGIQWVVTQALQTGASEAALATQTAASVAAAEVTAAAWSTAAAMTSLASFGANSGPAIAGISATVGASASLAAIPGFKEGGLVSGGEQFIRINEKGPEYVLNAETTKRIGTDTLDAINAGRVALTPARAPRSSVAAPAAQAAAAAPNITIKTINLVDPAMLSEYLSSSESDSVFINKISRNSEQLRRILNG
jgi:hypothetical protein